MYSVHINMTRDIHVVDMLIDAEHSRYLEYCYCFGLNQFDLSMEMFSDSKHNISTDVINENSKAARF